MFMNAGYNALYCLDLSSWNINNIEYTEGFNMGVETKVIAPMWKS